jgi:hypothetical protein
MSERRTRRITAFAVASWVGILVLVPCASCTSHLAHYPLIKASLTRQDFDAALERVEKINKSGTHLLYLYEKGLILHYENSFEQSNAALEEAELVYEDLYTKSLSRELASLISSDNVIAYRGERYEAALIHYFKIFNYLHLDDLEGALVECRKLNHLLQTFMDQEGSFYRYDPFLQYLTGMVYLAAGEYNDARISLTAALNSFDETRELYQVEIPEPLYCDLASCAAAMGDFDQAESFRRQASCRQHEDDPDRGTLNLFIECGYVPHKVEQNIVIPLYKDEIHDGMDRDRYAHTLLRRYDHPRDRHRKLAHLLRVAIPVMVSDPLPFAGARVRVRNGDEFEPVPATLVENLEVLAFTSFEEGKPGILLKTILRGLVKYLAREKTEEKKGEVAGWVVNAINIATESADTRSWATLPQSIRMSRLVLPAGTYDIEVELVDPLGRPTDAFDIPNVAISAGKSKFLNFRVY